MRIYGEEILALSFGVSMFMHINYQHYIAMSSFKVCVKIKFKQRGRVLKQLD